MKRNTSPQRVPAKFVEDMEGILKTRVNSNLLKVKDAKMPKAVELLTRTQGYQMSLKELKTAREKRK